ncbi:MAG TPA: hypothetical protein VK563_17340, partial [Puia sp.]|nr:hypothetical protein [Puia sp.]
MNFLNPFLKTKILFRIMVPVISFTMICGNTIAQNAKNTSITVPQWTTEQDYTEPHLSGKWHGEMKKIITVLASWIQEAWPDSQQCNPAWSGAYFSSKANALPVLKYELRAGFSGGHFNITVNDHSLLEQSLVCYRTSWSLLRPMKELYKGILYNEITGEKEDTAASPQTTRTWLITRAGKLPYTFITRREYLEEAKKEILMDKERVREHLKQLIPLRSAEEQEAAKKRDLQEIGNMYNGMMRANRERIYLEAYRPDSVYFNETLSARAA